MTDAFRGLLRFVNNDLPVEAVVNPLSMKMLEDGCKLLQEREKRIEEARAEWFRQYSESTPEEQRRRRAEWQALQEITGLEPDPVNPPVVHPETHQRIIARVEEILNELHST